MFGVFYYRSANPRTLAALSQFLPVPVEELTAEFAEGATPEDDLRAHAPDAHERGRAALLHQQPAAVARCRDAVPHSRPGGREPRNPEQASGLVFAVGWSAWRNHDPGCRLCS